MGLLNSPVTTSYSLHIVTVGLSLTVFAVLRLVTDRQTDRRTDGIGLAKGGTVHKSASVAKNYDFGYLLVLRLLSHMFRKLRSQQR